MKNSDFRLTAEWEPQAAILIAWPHADTDWADRLAEVEQTYIALITAITSFESAIICVANEQIRRRAESLLIADGIALTNIRFIEVSYDDTWLRDSGPITLTNDTYFRLCDFQFTGWGGKFAATRDDRLIENLIAQGLFCKKVQHQRIDWALEGGGIESDGAGTIMTTWRCLQQRHPQQTREEMTQILQESLNAKHVVWLEHGYLEGDDTDAHIDTLARFTPNRGIVFQACNDPGDPHYAELQAMREELALLCTTQNQPYQLHALPWPKPITDNGRRLAASYANFLIVNGGVLVPCYGDASDSDALQVVSRAFPQHKVVGVPCRPLIWQNGSLHCITMQLPYGVLA